jgi:micrococcal nuclease
MKFIYEYAMMVNVVDGDTMDFVIDLGFNIKHKIRVRLKNIDTPEIFHPSCLAEKEHGQKAKDFVSKYLNYTGPLITYRDKKGKFGRYLAEWYPEGMSGLNISAQLIMNGFEKKENYND